MFLMSSLDGKDKKASQVIKSANGDLMYINFLRDLAVCKYVLHHKVVFYRTNIRHFYSSSEVELL